MGENKIKQNNKIPVRANNGVLAVTFMIYYLVPQAMEAMRQGRGDCSRYNAIIVFVPQMRRQHEYLYHQFCG